MTLNAARPNLVATLICCGVALMTSPGLAQPADTASLLKTATNGSADARYEAIDDLGERHEAAETVVPQLAKLLHDSDPKVRWRAARSLGDYGEKAQPAAVALRELLNDKDPVVRYHAAVALGKIGDSSDETVDALVAAVTAKDARVARAAIAALRNLNADPKHVVAVMDHILASDDHAAVAYAIEAAVERGAKAVPVLNEALKRPNTAYLACAAIEQIGPEAADTVPALTDLLRETKHSRLLIQGILALASIGPAAQSASPQIIELLEHPTDETVPVAAAYALGAIGAEDADKPLREAASSSNEFLQMVASWSLAKIHPDDAALKKKAVEELKAGLKSDDLMIRAAAEKGLERLEPQANQAAPE